MIGRRPDRCEDHRAALFDFVDSRERNARTEAALAHLDRCRSCEQELTQTALTVAGLRWLGRELTLVEPPASAWPGVVARISRPAGPRWRWRMALGGVVASTALIAIIGAPLAIGRPAISESPQAAEQVRADLRVEAAYLASIKAGMHGPRHARPADQDPMPTDPRERFKTRREVKPVGPTLWRWSEI